MIENYLLHEQIGQGEYGKVYRATDISTQTTFAVKVVETQKLNENPKLLDLSLTEIKVLQTVSHCPYIIHFIQLIKTPIKYYFVYEYCAGGPLDKMLSLQGHLSEPKALQVFWQLLQAFKTLQQNRIMHRDLKPSNILIQNGTYKLADFGFCKPMDDGLGDVTTTMLGSPIYMAPEVLRGLSYDNRADVWSLGAVLYELLVGKCPFEEKSIAKLITAQDETNWCVPPQFSFRPQTMALLRSMLIKDPQRRCTWDYLFNQPLTKEGEFLGDVRVFESEPVCKTYNPLQPLDHNVNYTKDQQYATFQQFNVPYSPINGENQDSYKKPSFESFRTFARTNTFEIVKTPELTQQISLPPLPPPPKQAEPPENILSEVIRERNKVYFLCKALGDINKYNLVEKSYLYGYALLLLVNRRYQSLIRVIRHYATLTEMKEYPSLHRLLGILQRKNAAKKLVNNFEFVRLVDTIEKEANAINISLTEYRGMLDSMKLDLEKKELAIMQPNVEIRGLSSYLLGYINQLRSQYYLAFIDHKSDTDKHIMAHSLHLLDCLQVDVTIEALPNSDEVIEEFECSGEKRVMNERFEELLKRVQLNI